MFDFKRITEYFMENSVYVFTTDIDFAPEWAIKKTIDIFDDLKIPLTPFITHKSKAVDEYYDTPEKSKYIGLHPYPDALLQGSSFKGILKNLITLWPDARTIRSHGYLTKTKRDSICYNCGFRYDSNLCLFLQPYCTPLSLCSGLTRFPVWWEDDVYIAHKAKLTLETISEYLEIPGMKIIDIHPLLFALNVKNVKDIKMVKYRHHKGTKRWMRTEVEGIRDSSRWQEHASEGAGVQQFIIELIGYVKANFYKVMFLDDLYEELEKI